MGNKPSSFVPDDVKRQAECQTPIYNFVNLSGGGELIELMKKATKDNNYEEVSLCIFFDISYVCSGYLLWATAPPSRFIVTAVRAVASSS